MCREVGLGQCLAAISSSCSVGGPCAVQRPARRRGAPTLALLARVWIFLTPMLATQLLQSHACDCTRFDECEFLDLPPRRESAMTS